MAAVVLVAAGAIWYIRRANESEHMFEKKLKSIPPIDETSMYPLHISNLKAQRGYDNFKTHHENLMRDDNVALPVAGSVPLEAATAVAQQIKSVNRSVRVIEEAVKAQKAETQALQKFMHCGPPSEGLLRMDQYSNVHPTVDYQTSLLPTQGPMPRRRIDGYNPETMGSRAIRATHHY